MPPPVAPMLATTGPLPTADADWAFEPKWDGIRAITRLDGEGRIEARSRNGQDLTRRFPELAALIDTCDGTPPTLGGELVVSAMFDGERIDLKLDESGQRPSPGESSGAR